MALHHTPESKYKHWSNQLRSNSYRRRWDEVRGNHYGARLWRMRGIFHSYRRIRFPIFAWIGCVPREIVALQYVHMKKF